MRRAHAVLALLSVITALYFIFEYPLNVVTPFLNRFLEVRIPSPFYILVVGRDRNIEGTSRSDVIIILKLDHKDGKIGVANIPRDLIWNGRKVNSYYAEGGIDLLKKVVEEIANIHIHRYAIFDYESFKTLGDALGPIRVVVKQPMDYYDAVQDLRINFKPGVYYLNGQQLLAYVRYRKGGLGDLDRIRRQREVLKILVYKLMSEDVSEIAKIYSTLSEKIKTDLTVEEIFRIALDYRKGYKMSFLSFPSVLTDDGMLLPDKKRLEDFRAALKKEEELSEHEILRVVLVNAKKRKTKIFQPIEEARWKKIIGYRPVQFVWEDLGQHISGSVAYVTSRDERVYKKLASMLEKLYPHRDFKIYKVASLEKLEDYYKFISLMASKRKYPAYPIDAIVLLGDVQVP